MGKLILKALLLLLVFIIISCNGKGLKSQLRYRYGVVNDSITVKATFLDEFKYGVETYYLFDTIVEERYLYLNNQVIIEETFGQVDTLTGSTYRYHLNDRVIIVGNLNYSLKDFTVDKRTSFYPEVLIKDERAVNNIKIKIVGHIGFRTDYSMKCIYGTMDENLHFIDSTVSISTGPELIIDFQKYAKQGINVFIGKLYYIFNGEIINKEVNVCEEQIPFLIYRQFEI